MGCNNSCYWCFLQEINVRSLLDAVERNSRQQTKIMEAEVDIKGEKGQEIEDHHGLELDEDNEEKQDNQ